MIEKYLRPAKDVLQVASESFRRRPASAFISAIVAVLVGLAIFVAGALLVAGLGLYNVAATKKHSEAFGWFLHYTMRNSVKAHAPDDPPPPPDDSALIARGKRYFELRCAPCHGAPGRSADVVAGGMMPPPPGITALTREFNPKQLHWIIKHGIKMSAMPAWPAQHRDDEIWALVAYLEQAGKNPADYKNSPKEPEQNVGIGGTATLSTCFACHGSDGNGVGGTFPKLAGLSEGYIQRSLEDYRSRRRPSGFMQPFASNLSDEDIKNFAIYFGRLERQPPQQADADPAKVARGAKIAELVHNTRPLPACQTCHVREYPKRLSAIPDLAGQPKDYLSTQLKLFRSGIRAGTADAKIMGRIARELSDADIEGAAAYFSSLPVRSR